MTAERTYTIAEAASLYGMTEKALQRQIESGRLPKMKAGRLRVIPHGALHAAYPLKVPASPAGQAPTPSPAPAGGQGEGPAEPVRKKATPRPRGQDATAAILELTRRCEHLASELATHRLLATQAENTARMERQANEDTQRAVIEARARVLELEAVTAELRQQLSERDGRGRPGWFRRVFGAQGGDDGAGKGHDGGGAGGG